MAPAIHQRRRMVTLCRSKARPVPLCLNHNRQAVCWQSQRSSVVWPFSLQCSLQYLPCAPPLETMQLQAGCAHFIESDMAASFAATLTPFLSTAPRKSNVEVASAFRLRASVAGSPRPSAEPAVNSTSVRFSSLRQRIRARASRRSQSGATYPAGSWRCLFARQPDAGVGAAARGPLEGDGRGVRPHRRRHPLP